MPRFRWSPEHLMHMKTPSEAEAHRGPFAPQSAQNWFSGSLTISNKTFFGSLLPKDDLRDDDICPAASN